MFLEKFRDSDRLKVLFYGRPAWHDADIYIFSSCGFFFLLFLFPRLISVVGCLPYFHTWCGLSANLECMSEMCCSRLAENTGRKNDAKTRHLSTIAQLCRAISWQLRHVSTIGKKLLSSYISSTCPQYGELRPTIAAEIVSGAWGTRYFQGLPRLGSVTARHVVVGVSQTLRRWTEGATYVR